MRKVRAANIASLLALAAGTLWSNPAFAAWERAYGYALKSGERCPETDTPKLRPEDRRAFRIPAGFRGEIEVYGHGVDLSPSAEIASKPEWAGKARAVSGAENLARGCGSIGSLVIAFDVPADTPAGNFTLRFGTELMGIEIVKPGITGSFWSPETMQGRMTGGGAAGGGVRAIAGPVTVDTSGSNGCGPNTGNTGCSGGGGMTLTGIGAPGGGGSGGSPNLEPGVGGCLGDVGGRAQLSGATLTLDLPFARADTELACLTRPMFLGVTLQDGFRGDVGGFRAGASYSYPDPGSAVAPPAFGGNREGLTGPTVLARPNRDFQQLRMTAEFARSHVGERRVVLTPTAGSGASALTLVIRSDPGNGVRNVVGVPFAGPRTSSTIEVRIDYIAPAAGGRRFHWRLRAQGGSNPAACFAASSGSLTASAAIDRFTLTATEAAGCAGGRFNLDIGPERGGAAVFQAPYARTIAFTLPERSAPTLNPGLPPRN